MSTRIAVTGKHNDPDCTSFEGELFIESLESLFNVEDVTLPPKTEPLQT
jgi:hypothetical protein